MNFVNTEEQILPIGNKLLLLILNDGKDGSSLYLGTPVINDGIVFANKLIGHYRYECYVARNSTVEVVLNMIKRCVSFINKDVIIYYSGHGTQVTDMDGDEDDKKDEAFVFGPREYLTDDMFAHTINNNLKCKQLICVADCCHAGTIWDVKSLSEDIQKCIICISSCDDNQTSKQLSKNGVFTMNFWQLYDIPSNTLDIHEYNRRLHLFDQKIVTYPDNLHAILF